MSLHTRFLVPLFIVFAHLSSLVQFQSDRTQPLLSDSLIHLGDRPFFLMADRYQVYLVDLENEKFSAPMQPGMEIDYGNDAISGTLSGFQFFDEDRYLLGTAANYGIRARSNDEGDVFALYRLLGDKAIG